MVLHDHGAFAEVQDDDGSVYAGSVGCSTQQKHLHGKLTFPGSRDFSKGRGLYLKNSLTWQQNIRVRFQGQNVQEFVAAGAGLFGGRLEGIKP